MKYLKKIEDKFDYIPMEYKNVKFKVGDIVKFTPEYDNIYYKVKDNHVKGELFLITDIKYYYQAYDKHGHPIFAVAPDLTPIKLSYIKNNKVEYSEVRPSHITLVIDSDKIEEFKMKFNAIKYNI